MAKKVGTLIKEARTGAGLTQEQLARKIDGLSASDIGKAERGEKDLTQAQLKAIAKATGVTQKSLLDAAAGKSGAKTGSSGGKTSSSSGAGVKLTAEEKKLVNLYRKADDSQKEAALRALSGESGVGAAAGNILGSLLETAIGAIAKKD